jgi:hypothetical protein
MALVLAGCQVPVMLGNSSWIEAPLMADGLEDAASGGYEGFDTTLHVRDSSTAWLKFSLATLPSGDLWTLTSSGGTGSAQYTPNAYALTAAKVVSARLVVLVQSVNQPGYVNLALSPDAADGCFARESVQPSCQVGAGASAQATDADHPATPLQVTRTGFYSFDVTSLVRQGLGREQLAFALRPAAVAAGAAAGDFVIGSKEQDVEALLGSGDTQVSIPSSLAPSARLYVTLSDAVGQVSTTDIYSTAPNVRNFRYSASDPAVAGRNFNNQEVALLQGPPDGVQGDKAFFYAVSPFIGGLSGQFKSAVDVAFPGGLSVRQTLVSSTVAPVAGPSPSMVWYSMPYSNALTWSAWQPPSGNPVLASSPLAADVGRQTVLLDSTAPMAATMQNTYNTGQSGGLLFGVAATSATATPIDLRMGGSVQPRYITAITPRPQDGTGVYYDPGDNTYARTWCFGPDADSGACTMDVTSFSTKARVGRSYPAVRLISVMGFGSGSPGSGPYRTDMHISVPEQGASATLISSYLFQFRFGVGVDASRPLGYWVPLGTANRIPGSYEGVISMPGHNDRFTIHYENLPLPVPGLSGPTALSLPWQQGQASLTVPDFQLSVDDTQANLNDDTLRWRIASSHSADVVPSQVLNQGTGSQPFGVTFNGLGRRTLTVTSAGDAAATASMDVVLQASTATTLTASTASAMVGQSITLTASVQNGIASAAGMVRWRDGSQILGAAALDTSGQARLTTVLARGTHSLVAEYLGDADAGLLASQSAVLTVEVVQAVTSVQLQWPASLAKGQAAVVQASVAAVAPAAGVPDGQVGISLAGGSCTAQLANGQGQCSLTPTALGAAQVTGVYSGSASFAPSQVQYPANVGGPVPRVVFTSSPNPSRPGEPVTFTVVVSADVALGNAQGASLRQASAPVPGGTVVFADNGTELGRMPLDGQGSASWSTDRFVTPGTHAITVSYSGDAQNAAATQSLVQTVAGISVVPVPALGPWALWLGSGLMLAAAALARRRAAWRT